MASRTWTIAALVLLSAAALQLARSEREGPPPGAASEEAVHAADHRAPAASERLAVELAPVEPAPGMPRRPAQQAQLRGRVVDPWHRPVAGVGVQLLQAEQPVIAVQTAADGTFACPHARGGSPVLTLIAHDPRWAPAVVVHDASGGDDADLGEIALADGGACSGRVLDELGRPCAEARLLVEPVHGPLLRLPAAARTACIPEQGVDADGRFAIAHLPAGAYVVVATAPDRQRVASPRLTIREGLVTGLAPLLLGPGCTLQGQVFDPRGRPVAGAGVDLVAAAAPDPADLRHAVTDGCGAFLFAHLPPAPHHLRIAQPGCRTWVARDVDPRQAPCVAVHLQDGGSLEGRVVDAATGLPLPWFRVRLVRAEPPPDDGERDRARERARLQCVANGQLAGGDAAALAATLQAMAALEQQRRTAFRAREPFGPASAPQRSWSVVQQADGRFAFTGLDDGCCAIEVEAPGRPAVRTGPFAVPGGPAPLVVEVTVPDRAAGPGR